jgi:hypothetical protein
MSNIDFLKKINELRSEFSDSNHPLLLEVQELSEDGLQCLSDCFVNISNELAKCMMSIGDMIDVKQEQVDDLLSSEEGQEKVGEEDLENIAALASLLDKDDATKKYASLLDRVLTSYAFAPNSSDEDKQAFLKAIAQAQDDKKSDKKPKQSNADIENAKKIIKEKVKTYRPLESPLQTRSCPDHPGASMTRLEDHVFQCSLDKRIYDYKSGYDLLNGSKVPGGDVAMQTDVMNENPISMQSFTKQK